MGSCAFDLVLTKIGYCRLESITNWQILFVNSFSSLINKLHTIQFCLILTLTNKMVITYVAIQTLRATDGFVMTEGTSLTAGLVSGLSIVFGPGLAMIAQFLGCTTSGPVVVLLM